MKSSQQAVLRLRGSIRAILMVAVLLLLATGSMAKTPSLHPIFPMLDENGQNVLNSGQAVSTMQTCGSCHDTRYIAGHSFHVDAGLNAMAAPGSFENGHPWDTSPGYFGKWSPLTYRTLSPAGEQNPDMDQAEWIRTLGYRHVGGGPAELNQAGKRLTISDSETWNWEKSGVEEMNCFLCHIAAPDNASRVQTLKQGNFRWANTATLLNSGIVEAHSDSFSWSPEAFDNTGNLKREYLTIQDPSNSNCGQCHGLVYTAGDAPANLSSCDWNTATTGEIIAPQRINRTE